MAGARVWALRSCDGDGHGDGDGAATASDFFSHRDDGDRLSETVIVARGDWNDLQLACCSLLDGVSRAIRSGADLSDRLRESM